MNVNLKFLFHIIKLCSDILKILVFLVIQLDPHRMNLKKNKTKGITGVLRGISSKNSQTKMIKNMSNFSLSAALKIKSVDTWTYLQKSKLLNICSLDILFFVKSQHS